MFVYLHMGIQAKTTVKESIEELTNYYKRERNAKMKLRLKSLIFIKEKKFKKQTILATHLGINYSTLKKWLKEYREEGLTYFITNKSGGYKPSIINQQIHDALSKRLHDSKKVLKVIGTFNTG